ncbi:MAG: dihydropteroate synthase [Ignavibacteriae bacterium]|nr:dihydropteroate synthase [Ignavibacteriota bacterium]
MNFPKIMGIVNVTPDSFSDGGKYYKKESAVQHALNLIEEGAEYIDIGGESTRPGAAPVDDEEELRRVVPVIKSVKKEKPDTIISIDTTKPFVALGAVGEGAKLINNIAGIKNDEKLLKIASENHVGLIIMHIQGEPRTMQNNPVYNNVVEEIYTDLRNSVNYAGSKGIKNIIADVGIGFGKTLEHNIEILKHIERFYSLNVPLLLGISRKSFIGKLLNIEKPDDRDLPTVMLHSLLLTKKIDIIRVHNVKNLYMLKQLYNKIN